MIRSQDVVFSKNQTFNDIKKGEKSQPSPIVFHDMDLVPSPRAHDEGGDDGDHDNP